MVREAERTRTEAASQQLFLPLFALSSLPCGRKAASSAPKINQKSYAERCLAVFRRWHLSKTKKITQTILLCIIKGFSAVLGNASA